MPAFDTLKATKLLKASGFEETQAEAVVATVRDAVSDNVATKADMGELRAEMGALRAELKADMGELRAEFKADMGELRAELKADIAELRASMYRMVLTTSLAVIGATVSLVKLLP